MQRRAWHLFATCLTAMLLATVALPLTPNLVPGAPWRQAIAQQSGSAQEGAGPAANFLNPFPENDSWRGLMIGDYLAEGLLVGLLDAMASEQRLQLQRRHRPLATLSRGEIEEDAKALDDFVAKEKIHIAVIVMGMGDRNGIRLPTGRRLPVGQGEWRTQYAARVDRIVRALRRRGVAVYWVGVPIMRRPDQNEDVEAINDVLRERTLSNGGRYIDAYKESADENGQFTDRGPDIAGKLVRLRDPEGFEFTPAGYRKLAFFIERQLKRDMNAAKEERTIPLAGAEPEQKRINPEGTRIANAGASDATQPGAAQVAAIVKGTAKDARAAASPVTRALTPGATAAPPEAPSSSTDLRADNVRVSFKSAAAGGREEQVTIEIVRPALTQSVIQLVTRRDKGDKPSQIGDTLTDTLSNGLLVMRSVTPTRGGSDRASQRGALTQQPFFIALAKGERLPPKPGRADDFRWPREDDIPPPPVATSASPISSPVPLGQPAATGARPPRGAPRVRAQRNEQPDRPASSVFQQ